MSPCFVRASSLAIGVMCAAPVAAQGVPNPDLDRAHHVLRRITFGPTPDLVNELANPAAPLTPLQAVSAYISEQLAPSAAQDPYWPYGGFEVMRWCSPGSTFGLEIPASPAPGVAFDQFQAKGTQLAYALSSKWQLREVMAQFWERHFNTHLVGSKAYFNAYPSSATTADAHAWFFEWEANNYYRDNALGTFYDLLDYTSTHATMVVYLHMYRNIVQTPGVDEPNEDYARELLELYTMGPEMSGVPNYDQSDIETVASILSGWSIDESNGFAFTFNGGDHDTRPKPTMFSVSGAPYPLPPGTTGQAEGDQLLMHLAGRTATADFVCRKLMDYFLGDGAAAAEPALLASMIGAWGASGDITAVLTVLLDINGPFGNLTGPNSYVGVRARLPLEAVLAPPRAFGAALDPDAVDYLSLTTTWLNLEAMGQVLLQYPAPIGFPQSSAAQLSPSAAMLRFRNAAMSLVSSQLPPSMSLEYDIGGSLFAALQPTPYDPVLVSKEIIERLHGTRYSANDELAVRIAMANMVSLINQEYAVAGSGATVNVLSPTDEEYERITRAGVIVAMGMSQGAIR